jgi:hypothetical protein
METPLRQTQTGEQQKRSGRNGISFGIWCVQSLACRLKFSQRRKAGLNQQTFAES